MSSWPLATDYSAAVQNPAGCFADAELASGRAAADLLGLPLTYAGNFANVYKMECAESTAWAVKCFTRQVADLQQRYAAISAHLDRNRRKFAVEFRYLQEGIRVKGAWYPALKMRWVEGFTLNEFVRDHAGNAALLEQLAALWLRLGNELRESRMAHGDLQHGNVLLVPGTKAAAMVLRLIDYDGMWVPELADKPPGEVGHPNYQHPQRLREGGYSAEIDRFAHLAIYTALRCLAAGGSALWNDHDNGENLLFKESDFRDPAKSKLWLRLLGLPEPGAVALASHLLAACCGPLERVPLTADLVSDAKVAALSAEQRELIREKVAGSRPAKPAAPPPPPPPVPDAPKPRSSPRRSKVVLAKPAEPLHEPALAQETYPEAIPLLPLVPPPPPPSGIRPIAVVDPWAVPEAAVALETPPVPATKEVALDDTLEARTLPPPLPVPAARPKPAPPPLFPAPDWLVGLGLSPDGAVARYWPICLGVLLGLPLVVGVLWVAWSATRPRPAPNNGGGSPPVQRPRITLPSRPAELRAGRSADAEFVVERGESEPALRLVVSNLPPGVRAEEAVVPPGVEPVTVPVRLSAALDVPTGVGEPVVTLYRGTEEVDRQTWTVSTRQFLRPQLGKVSAVELKAGQSTSVLAEVRTNGNTDPLTLSVEPLPDKVTASPLLELPAGTVGVRLRTDHDAEAVTGRLVQLILRADGLMADQKTVALSIEPRPRDPLVFLKLQKGYSLRAGSRVAVEVRVARRFYDGVVRLVAEDLPAGVTAEAVDVPAGQDSGTLTLNADLSAATREMPPVQIAVSARVGERRAGRERVDLTLRPALEVPKEVVPKAAQMPRPEEVVIPTGDGLRLKATFYPPPDVKKGATVLMLPELALGRKQREWQALALRFQKQGCAVLALDFRGFGENLTSAEEVSANYLKVPANLTVGKAILAQLRINGKVKLASMSDISGEVFPATYYPWLVQDIVAARLWLDLKHDHEELNSSNLVLVAEGESANLAMVWLATEARRYKAGGLVPGVAGHQYEVRDLAGAVWLEPKVTLRGFHLAGVKTARDLVTRDVKTWPPMLVVHGEGGGTAKLWLKAFKQDGKAGAEKAVNLKGGGGPGQTLLAAEGVEGAATDYLEEVLKRALKPWAKRDVQTSAYTWHLGAGRSSPAKQARATVPALCPMESWGFAGLKIR